MYVFLVIKNIHIEQIHVVKYIISLTSLFITNEKKNIIYHHSHIYGKDVFFFPSRIFVRLYSYMSFSYLFLSFYSDIFLLSTATHSTPLQRYIFLNLFTHQQALCRIHTKWINSIIIWIIKHLHLLIIK